MVGGMTPQNDEWKIIESLLPEDWGTSARETKAFRRVRYTSEPGHLLRLLLFHAVNGSGLRETVAQAKAAGIASMSQVALFKRLKTSGPWLEWIAARLAARFRARPSLEGSRRLRALDSTTIQGPASKGTDWRLHYTIDLRTLGCDWHELTDAKGAELLERTAVKEGDVLLADRNFLRPLGVKSIVDAKGDLVVRLRWTHSLLTDATGRRFQALTHARRLRVGKVGDWAVHLPVAGSAAIEGRVVATRLPALVAAKAERRALKSSKKKGTKTDPRTLEAAHFVLLFTTLSREELNSSNVLELYRCRWQIELVFKRMKQLLKLGQLPHKQPATARAWIAAKLVVALLLEALYRNARALSPWGFEIQRLPA
jgi:hypothetical protein